MSRQNNLEKLSGIVERIIYHNPKDGWSVLKVNTLNNKIERISAGIKHVIDTSRESGHCYLRFEQIEKKTVKLLNLENKEIINNVIDKLY
jgi:hypothetical protein